ncbi:MAG: dephospho-CoA kinase [Bacteroidota bacterium]
MIKVGVTGGIGSGKTLICQVFEKLGAPVFYADQEARKILNHDKAVIDEVSRIFGADIYDEYGINKANLASIIFNNHEALNTINGIVHPVVKTRFQNWLSALKTPYAIEEAAILVETGSHNDLDFTILVYAPGELRISRAMARDGKSREEIEERMKNQMPDEEKFQKVNKVIYNDNSRMVIPQVLEIHEQLMNYKNLF